MYKHFAGIIRHDCCHLFIIQAALERKKQKNEDESGIIFIHLFAPSENISNNNLPNIYQIYSANKLNILNPRFFFLI